MCHFIVTRTLTVVWVGYSSGSLLGTHCLSVGGWENPITIPGDPSREPRSWFPCTVPALPGFSPLYIECTGLDGAILRSPIGLSIAVFNRKSVAFVRTLAFAADGAAVQSTEPIGVRQTVPRARTELLPDIQAGKLPSHPPRAISEVSPRRCIRGNPPPPLPLARALPKPLIPATRLFSWPPSLHFYFPSWSSVPLRSSRANCR